jgi:hypothetical protein
MKKRFISVLLGTLTSQFTKTQIESKDISIDMRKMRIGPRAVLIALVFGVGGYCGTNQVLNHHIKILKKDF